MKLVENYEDKPLPKLVLYSKGNIKEMKAKYGEDYMFLNTKYSSSRDLQGMRFSEVIFDEDYSYNLKVTETDNNFKVEENQ